MAVTPSPAVPGNFTGQPVTTRPVGPVQPPQPSQAQQGQQQGPPPGGVPSVSPPSPVGGGPAPVAYNIANVSQPQIQSAATTAPASTMAQNAANARANQAALNSFFGTGTGFAPQYEVDYGKVAAAANQGQGQNLVQGGGANNPT